MTFRVGQKVVCVDDSECWIAGRRQLALNAIYTIRGIDPDYPDRGVFLFEVRLPEERNVRCKNPEPSFRASRFRPLIERKTDISIFSAMLGPAPSKQKALRKESQREGT